jgi:hypothetical protein
MNNDTSPATLGRTLITPKAKQALHPQEVLSALWRHARAEGPRMRSNHRSSRGEEFQIVTDADAGTTHVLLSKETDFSEAGLLEDWVCNLGCPNCGG